MSSTAASTRRAGAIRGGLDADVTAQYDEFQVQVRCTVAPGEVVAVLGPNGAGKSTLLRTIAGLVPLQAGRVRLGGDVLEDAAAGIRRPPQERDVGMVFQDLRLFPHLDVVENVAFGLRSRGLPRREARRRAGQWLERVGLAEVTRRRPGSLSGGQRQRVALARALVTEPRLLLLDEPLAALDVETRQLVRRTLHHHVAAFDGPVVLVTHDPLEALTLADRLVVIEHGRVVQDASPSEVARRPRSAWTAQLVGLNAYRGRLRHGGVIELDAGGQLVVARPHSDLGEEVFVALHPRSVAVYLGPPTGSPRNTWAATVTSLDVYGDQVRVWLDGAIPVVAEITPAALADLGLVEGQQVWVAIKANDIDHWPV